MKTNVSAHLIGKLIGAKCVEKKEWAVLKKITLKQIILKELLSLATSATKLSGPERVLDNININMRQHENNLIREFQ